jgi:hypothetical protein
VGQIVPSNAGKFIVCSKGKGRRDNWIENPREKVPSSLDLTHGPRADIQRRGSILSWIEILSVYGADTIAIDLSLSALVS